MRQAHFDMVRLGILPLGVFPSSVCRRVPGIQSVMTVKARIAGIQHLQPGDTVGYGMRYTAANTRRIAVLPIGYDDGYRRSFSGRAPVLLTKGAVPTVGAISMDLTVCDATDVPAAAGDRAVLIGTCGGRTVSARDLAAAAGTIPYEILCGIGRRVPRRYD